VVVLVIARISTQVVAFILVEIVMLTPRLDQTAVDPVKMYLTSSSDAGIIPDSRRGGRYISVPPEIFFSKSHPRVITDV
jgi:hypothetical protein